MCYASPPRLGTQSGRGGGAGQRRAPVRDPTGRACHVYIYIYIYSVYVYVYIYIYTHIYIYMYMLFICYDILYIIDHISYLIYTS